MINSKSDLKELSLFIVERLKGLKPYKIILFGSYAYGEPDNNSDIDICLIQEKQSSKIQLKKEIRKRLKDIELSKDILVPSLEEYDFYKNEYGSVFMDIEKSGKVLWINS